MKFEYGAMSSRFYLEANNKLTAYAAMLLHFVNNPNLIALYEPEEIVKYDSWLDPTARDLERVYRLFGGEDKFYQYAELNKSDIIAAYKTITQIL